MSQITVRVPDEVLAFIDAHTDNRTSYVLEALERERRRRIAEEDIIALAAAGDEAHAEAESIASSAARIPLDVD